MQTRIEFDDSHALDVDESLSEVESKLRRAEPNVAALVEFTRKEKKVLVNAALVRVVREAPSRKMQAF